jgi:hypothetical protein
MFTADVVGGTAAIRPGFRGALYTLPPKRFSVAMNIALGTLIALTKNAALLLSCASKMGMNY